MLLAFFPSCSTPPTDMRSLAPADSIVYLESGDLGKTLESLTQNPAWESGAAGKSDFSALENIQVAVAVTSFETAETQVTAESSVLNFKPHFVVIADTHQWKPTAVSIAENQLGKFAKTTYGDDVKFEEYEKRDAKFMVWTSASDSGRKFFAAVSKSIIYFSNDESLVDKCLSVQRGEAESLLKNENLASAREGAGGGKNLAFGYVSPEGVKQIADLIGISAAMKLSEADAIRSFIAKNLPEVLQKSVREVVWSARKNDEKIEDKFTIKTDADISDVFKETLTAGNNNEFQTAAEFLPQQQFESVTFYNLQNPQIAWRSVLLVTSKQMDATSAKLLIGAANAFFEPYGIANGEDFLSAVNSQIVTARFDDGEKSVVIAGVKNLEKVKQSISGEINFKLKPEKVSGAEIWQSEDKSLAAAFIENKIISGDRESVLNCLSAKESGRNFAQTVQFQNAAKSSSLVTTVAKDAETPAKIIEILGKPKETKDTYNSFYITQTDFAGNAFERHTFSDFGLLGTIVEKFGKGN